MDDIQALTAAIAEVVNVSFPVSLTTLKRVLKQADQRSLNTWCRIKSCQIPPLVANLCHRRKYDEEAFNCLIDLIQCDQISSTVANDPHLIEDIYSLVERALGYKEISTSELRVFSAVVHLSFASDLPFPKTFVDLCDSWIQIQVVLPDSTKFPDGVWSQEILPLLATAPNLLLHLQESSIAVLTKKWKQLLRSENHQDAVAAVHVAHRLWQLDLRTSTGKTCTPTVTSGNLQEWLEKAASLFEGAKAISVLDTVMLIMLKASSQGACSLNMGDMVEKCQEIVCGADQLILQEWTSINISVITKLMHKSRAVTRLNLRLEAAVLRVLATLPMEDRQSDQGRLRQVIGWIMQWCPPGLELHQRTYSATELAIYLVQSLHVQIQNHPNVAGSVVDVLLEAGVAPEWWSLDLATPESPANCGALPACLHTLELRRQHLCSAISFLLLQAASTSDRIVKDDIIRRLRQQLSTSKSVACCQYPMLPQINPPLALTVNTSELGKDWRRHLCDFMSDVNDQTSETVEAIIYSVCKDLNHRCENVEEPLRKTQQEASELAGRLSNAQQELQIARVTVAQLNELVEKEKTNRDSQLQSVQNLEGELSGMQHQLQNCQLQLLEVKEDAVHAKEEYERSICESKAMAQQDVVEVRQKCSTKISKLEDQLRSKTQAEANLQSENAWLAEEMATMRQELTLTYETALADLKAWHNSECAGLRKQIAALEDLSSLQVEDLRSTERLLAEEGATARRLSEELGEARRDIAERVHDLEHRDKTISALQASLQETREQSARLKGDQEEAKAEQARLTTHINELEEAKAALRKQCQAQAKALEIARRAEQSVMAIFQGRQQPAPSSVAAMTVTMTPSQDRRSSPRRLPEFSFGSEDDEDYSEVMKET